MATERTVAGEKIFRYDILTTLNHGLARQNKPLPPGIPIKLSFARSKATKSLLQISDKKQDQSTFTFDGELKLINPTLACYFVESKKADEFYSKTKMYDIAVPFLDYSVRRELLMNGVSEHSLKIFEGPLPSVLVIGLIEPEVFDGDYAKSVLKFQRHDLESAEVIVDGQAIVNHPLKLRDGSSIEFFGNYLQNTNRWRNLYATGSLSYKDFVHSNFLIFCNLKADGYQHGQMNVQLKFKDPLAKKLYCLFIPVTEKKLEFDSFFNAKVISL